MVLECFSVNKRGFEKSQTTSLKHFRQLKFRKGGGTPLLDPPLQIRHYTQCREMLGVGGLSICARRPLSAWSMSKSSCRIPVPGSQGRSRIKKRGGAIEKNQKCRCESMTFGLLSWYMGALHLIYILVYGDLTPQIYQGGASNWGTTLVDLGCQIPI